MPVTKTVTIPYNSSMYEVVTCFERLAYSSDGQLACWRPEVKETVVPLLLKEAPDVAAILRADGYEVEKWDSSPWTYYLHDGVVMGRFYTEELS